MSRLNIISWSGRGEGVYAERFSDALLTAAAAEHVALGSSHLRQEGTWFDPFGRYVWQRPTSVVPWPDSSLARREQFVRAEIRLLDVAKP